MAQDIGLKEESSIVLENNYNNLSRTSVDTSNHVNQPAFSIATPAVTTILPMTENINDTSFITQTTLSYPQDLVIEQPYSSNISNPKPIHDTSETSQRSTESGNSTATDLMKPTNVQPDETNKTPNSLDQTQNMQQQSLEEGAKQSKKRNRVMKKSTKLDAKSKLEKSRQSARECRARKKLRYQYLEDLVCNREKAVIKLKEELFMFFELSKQIDNGNITEAQRRLLSDQTKENTCGESTS